MTWLLSGNKNILYLERTSVWYPKSYSVYACSKGWKANITKLNQRAVQTLLDNVDNLRDKAVIALFVESGLRLSELADISPQNIDWDKNDKNYW